MLPQPSALRARGKQGKHVPGGAPRAALRAHRWRGDPRSHSRPAGRPTLRPSLPGDAPRRANSAGSARSFRSGAATVFRRQGPRLLPGRGSAGAPRGRRPVWGLRRWRAARPDARLRYGCGFRPRSVLRGPGSHLPTFPPRCGDGPDAEPSGKTRRRPRSGLEPPGGRGVGRRGWRAPRAPRPPPSRGAATAPVEALRPGSAPRPSPSAAQAAPSRPAPRPRPHRPRAPRFSRRRPCPGCCAPPPRVPPASLRPASVPPSPRPITARRRRSLCLDRGSGPMGLRGDVGGAPLGQWAGRAGGEGRRRALGARPRWLSARDVGVFVMQHRWGNS